MAAPELETIAMDDFHDISTSKALTFSMQCLADLVRTDPHFLYQKGAAFGYPRSFSFGHLLKLGLEKTNFSMKDFEAWLSVRLIDFGVAEYRAISKQVCHCIFPPQCLSDSSMKQHSSAILHELIVDCFENPPDAAGFRPDWSDHERALWAMLSRLRCMADKVPTSRPQGPILGDRTILRTSSSYWTVTAEKCSSDLLSGARPFARDLAYPFMPMAADAWGSVKCAQWTQQHVVDWVSSLFGWSANARVAPIVLQIDTDERPQFVHRSLATQLKAAVAKPKGWFSFFVCSDGPLDEPVPFGAEQLLVARVNKETVAKMTDHTLHRDAKDLFDGAAIVYLRWSRVTSLPPEPPAQDDACSARPQQEVPTESTVPAAQPAVRASSRPHRAHLLGETSF